LYFHNILGVIVVFATIFPMNRGNFSVLHAYSRFDKTSLPVYNDINSGIAIQFEKRPAFSNWLARKRELRQSRKMAYTRFLPAQSAGARLKGRAFKSGTLLK